MQQADAESAGEASTRNALVIVAGTLFSRVLGFVRDAMLAALLGFRADVFIAAFRIPNLLRRMVAEGTLGMAHTAALAQFPPPVQGRFSFDAYEFSWRMLGAMLVFGIICAIVLGLCSGWILECIAPGLSSAETSEAAYYFRLCLPYIPLAAGSAVGAAALTSVGRFFAPAFSPALLNLGMVLAGFFVLFSSEYAPSLVPFFAESPASLFCFGVVAGGGAQFFLLVWYMLRAAPEKSRFSGGKESSIKERIVSFFYTQDQQNRGKEEKAALCLLPSRAVRAVLREVPLTTLGASSQPVNMLVGMVAASFLVPGSISFLYFAERLAELPIGIAGAAIGVAILPDLARKAVQDTRAEFGAVLVSAIRLSLFLSLPAAAGLAGLSLPIVSLLFGYGVFGWSEQITIATCAIFLALGIPAMCLSRLLVAAAVSLESASLVHERRGLHSYSMVSTLVSAGVMALGCLTLAPVWGVCGVAASASIAVWVQVVLLLLYIYKRRSVAFFRSDIKWIASYALGAVALFSLLWFGVQGFLPERGLLLGIALAGVIFAGVGGWFALFALLKSTEHTVLVKALRSSR